MITMPLPDEAVLARRADIASALRRMVKPAHVIDTPASKPMKAMASQPIGNRPCLSCYRKQRLRFLPF
jgi:hypothetical protein